MSVIGAFSKTHWMVLRRCQSSPTHAAPVDLLRASLNCLLEACRDSIGTVRAAAQRALGESIITGALSVYFEHGAEQGEEKRAARGPPSLPGELVNTVLEALSAGCRDTKLAVRLQAVWALGNLVLACLPFRNTSGQNQSRRQEEQYISDALWLSAYKACVVLVSDSEKLLSSAVRCVGFLAGGLRRDCVDHRLVLKDILDLLLNRILFASKGTGRCIQP